ncbi:MAG: hypothetical protein MUC42_10505 [Bryobacter sp.]|nr:hypothetical protein [Bryobacter sp.]
MTNIEHHKMENEFDQWMMWLCDECFRLFGRRPLRFQAMVAQNYGVPTAKLLLRPTPHNQSVAFEELNNSQGHFQLTMEYFVVQRRYRPLFTEEESKEAEERLAWFPGEPIDRDRYSGHRPA